MHSAIELWLAEYLKEIGADIEYNHFRLNSGAKLAIIDSQWSDILFAVITKYWEKEFNKLSIKPQIHNSDIDGVVVMVHKYYQYDDALDGLLTGELKETAIYKNIIELGVGNSRFDVDDFKSFICENIIVTNSDNNVEEDGVEEAQEAAPEEVIESEDEKAKKKIDEFFARFKNRFGTPSTVHKHIDCVHTAMVYGRYNGFPETNVIGQLIEKTGKNIIFFLDGSSAIEYILQENYFSYSEYEENNILIILLTPEYNKRLSPLNQSALSLCFGYTTGILCVVKGRDPNRNIRDKRDSGNNNEVDNMIKEGENSSYAKFDQVFKDHATNVVWALKDRPIIMFTTKLIGGDDLSDTLMNELIRRINGDVKYSELLKIDHDYQNQISKRNQKEYIEFAVASISSMLEELNRLKKESEEDYKMHIDKAMESGKTMEKYIIQINSFDADGMKMKEEENALQNYKETLALSKVNSINIEEGIVNIYTHNLYAMDERKNRWHDIGTFHIKLGMLSNNYDTANTVRIYNTKHQINGYQTDMQAPHVFNDGHICHGNLAIGLTNSYKNRNLYELVLQIILFLQTVNTDDVAGAHVNKWPEVLKELATSTKNDSDIKEMLEEISEVEKEFDEAIGNAIPVHI